MPSESATGLRDLESRFIKAVFDHMADKPNTDWARVAEDMGLKDAKCARERFRQMSLRHGWGNASNGNGNGSPGNGTGNGNGASDGAEVTASPVKGGRVAKKPRAPRTPRKKGKGVNHGNGSVGGGGIADEIDGEF